MPHACLKLLDLKCWERIHVFVTQTQQNKSTSPVFLCDHRLCFQKKWCHLYIWIQFDNCSYNQVLYARSFRSRVLSSKSHLLGNLHFGSSGFFLNLERHYFGLFMPFPMRLSAEMAALLTSTSMFPLIRCSSQWACSEYGWISRPANLV